MLGLPKLWLAALIVAVSLCPRSGAQNAPLFFPINEAKVAPAPPYETQHLVRIDSDQLLPWIAAVVQGQKTQSPVFNLLPGLETEVTPQYVETGESTVTLTGTATNGQAWLVLHKDALAGQFRFDDGRLVEVLPQGNETYAINEYMAIALQPCVTAVPPAALPQTAVTSHPKQDTASVVDVFIVYTPAVRNHFGGNTESAAFAELAVNVTNSAYAASEVPHRVRLVGSAEVEYAESGNFQTDLDRLTFPGDGHIESVHAMRAATGADIVVMLVNHGDLAGLAWILQNVASEFGEYGFAVVHQQYAASFYVLAHELGHIMGCAHERGPNTIEGAFPYAHALIRQSHRTVMASVSTTDSIGYFTSPLLLFGNEPLGFPAGAANSADNARVLRTTMPVASAFRVPPFRTDPAVINVPFSSGQASFNVIADAPGATNWHAEILTGGSWLTLLSAADGVNNGQIIVGHANNDRDFGRTARIRLTATGSIDGETEVLISQAANCGFLSGPLNVQATDGVYTDRIRVSWSAIESAEAYRVYRSRTGNLADAVAVSGWLGDTAAFDDFTAQAIIQPIPNCELGIVRSPRYTYWVRARNGCGESAYSDPDEGFVALPAQATLLTWHTAGFLLVVGGTLAFTRRMARLGQPTSRNQQT